MTRDGISEALVDRGRPEVAPDPFERIGRAAGGDDGADAMFSKSWLDSDAKVTFDLNQSSKRGPSGVVTMRQRVSKKTQRV